MNSFKIALELILKNSGGKAHGRITGRIRGYIRTLLNTLYIHAHG